MSSSTTRAGDALATCLARCGTDQAALVASIDEAVGLRPGDLVLAVGSVAEGLANDKSDLDLLLVAGDDVGHAETELCWAVGRSMVDLRILHPATVEALTGKLRDWARRPWSLVELAPFSDDERLLLHRLREGLVVHPLEPVAQPWRPDRSELARLKLQVARHQARTIQVDLVGYRAEGDYATFVLAAQDLLGHGVDGLLAGHHLTNPNPKWRSRLLARLPLDWERPLWLRPTGVRADRAFWDLHRAPALPEPESAVAHAVRCAGFARAAFAWAERRLLGTSDGVPRTPLWDGDRAPAPGPVLPGIEFDVDFFRSDTGIAVARLNEFGASLRLSEREFALLLLCDGRTSVAEAEAVVNSTLSNGKAGNGKAGNGSAPLDGTEAVERMLHGGLFLRTPQAVTGAVERLGEELARSGYGEFLTCFDPFVLDPSAWRAARTHLPPALGPVVDLFLLGQSVSPSALPPGLAALVPGLTTAGLLAERDGWVAAADLVVLLVCGSWVICHPPQADPLFYLGDDSLALLSRLTPAGARNCLDLCAGPGLHAVHCARFAPEVTAVELDPRVARIARLNARLNGVADRVEVLPGDLYEPVAGRRFDLVVANPPTLPYPADLPGPRVGHGGEDGLRVTSRVLAGLPDALTDRGRAHLAGMTLTDGTPGPLVERLSVLARENDLALRCTVISHARLAEGGAVFERLVPAVAAIADAAPDRVRESYARLLGRLRLSHLSTYFLQVSRGSGAVEPVDVSTSGRPGLWHI
ncbi:methyltransferase [Saccharothrix sp. NRRL B-16314]|uniref:methyltransferase n=1 Tax=Saccharothrix sp. NRRL B-16314 TaxID=1463825 RepID=UPI000525ADE6|nr:methyltransferase [Saccharothrix sp. NRRL B-16314]